MTFIGVWKDILGFLPSEPVALTPLICGYLLVSEVASEGLSEPHAARPMARASAQPAAAARLMILNLFVTLCIVYKAIAKP